VCFKGLVCIFVCFYSLDQFGFVGCDFSKEIGWEERPQNDLFCVEWGVKSYSCVDLCMLFMSVINKIVETFIVWPS